MDFLAKNFVVVISIVAIYFFFKLVGWIIRKIEGPKTKDEWGMPLKNKLKKGNRFDEK